eukprot:XP_014034403.1 PREDICTED: uncharacterized protein LOC106589207 [Salmo salar]
MWDVQWLLGYEPPGDAQIGPGRGEEEEEEDKRKKSPLLLSPVTAASPAQSHTHPEKGQQNLVAPVLVSLSEGLNDIHRDGIRGNGGSVRVPVRGRGPGHLQSVQPIHCQRVKGQTDPSTLQSQMRCRIPIGQEAGQLLRPQQALQGGSLGMPPASVPLGRVKRWSLPRRDNATNCTMPVLTSTTLPHWPTATKHCGPSFVPVVVPINVIGCSMLCRTLTQGPGRPGRSKGREQRRPSGRPQRIMGELMRAASTPKRSLKRRGSRRKCLTPSEDDDDDKGGSFVVVEDDEDDDKGGASLLETVTKVPPDPPTSIREHTPSSLAASELDDTLNRAGPGDWSAGGVGDLTDTSSLPVQINTSSPDQITLAAVPGEGHPNSAQVSTAHLVSIAERTGKITGQKVYSYTFNSPNYSEPEMHMLNMHSAIVVLLPLSLVLLVFGGICGLISSLARSPTLLIGTASYLILCSVLTLSGVSLYISYSQQALAETERLVGAERLAQVVSTSFGWSLALAWLSFCLEVITGLLLLLAARLATLQHGPQGHGWPLHVVT